MVKFFDFRIESKCSYVSLLLNSGSDVLYNFKFNKVSLEEHYQLNSIHFSCIVTSCL